MFVSKPRGTRPQAEPTKDYEYLRKGNAEPKFGIFNLERKTLY